MPTLKFKIKDFEFEYIGEHQDMIKFIQELMASPSNVNILATTPTKSLNPKFILPEHAEKNLKITLPSNESVLQYITSQPDYKHTLFAVQEHFFNQIFRSRGNTINAYMRTKTQLDRVHKEIEKQFNGRFEKERGKKRLFCYTFKKASGLV